MAASSQISQRAPVSGFEWDHANREKCEKHGVSIAAIEGALRRPIAIFPDLQHSIVEERLKAIGVTDGGRHVLIVLTLRRHDGATFIRPISARYMHRKEIEHYEKTAPGAQNR